MATHWLGKILPQIRKSKDRKASQVPEGLWRKCPACEAILYRPELERSLDVCPKCDHHLRVSARRRLELFFDKSENVKWIGESIGPRDPLKFKDSKKYKDRLLQAEKNSQSSEALLVAEGHVLGRPVVVSAFEFSFMGGSMGTAVGSRFVAGVKRAIEQKVPFICFSASGGARMQEAVLSLMQMAKVSTVLEQLALAKLPYISIMTDPVYGGVSASLAMLGDINMAEPNALIGFTGPRVIEQTVRQKLPEGFQRSEFLLAHGSLDMIVHRHQLRETVARLVAKFPSAVPATVENCAEVETEVLDEDSSHENTASPAMLPPSGSTVGSAKDDEASENLMQDDTESKTRYSKEQRSQEHRSHEHRSHEDASTLGQEDAAGGEAQREDDSETSLAEASCLARRESSEEHSGLSQGITAKSKSKKDLKASFTNGFHDLQPVR